MAAPAIGVDAPDFAQPAAVIAMLTVSALAPSFKIIFIELLTLVSGFPDWPGEIRPVSTQAKVYTMLSPNLNHDVLAKNLGAPPILPAGAGGDGRLIEASRRGWSALQGLRASQRQIKAP